MSLDAKRSFDYVVRSLADLDSIYEFLSQQAPSLNGSAILRAKYVLIVSAFDTYIHAIVEEKIIGGFGKESSCELSKLNIPLNNAYDIICANEPTLKEQLFAQTIKSTLSKYSYQSPRNVENALQIIGISHIWRMAKNYLDMSAEDIQKKLSIIVQRRNQIAHESDFDDVSMQFREIKKSDVEEVTWFLSRLVEVIEGVRNMTNAK